MLTCLFGRFSGGPIELPLRATNECDTDPLGDLLTDRTSVLSIQARRLMYLYLSPSARPPSLYALLQAPEIFFFLNEEIQQINWCQVVTVQSCVHPAGDKICCRL